MIKTIHNTKPISSSANSTGILHTLQSDGWRLDLKTPLFANSSCTFEKHSPAPSPDYSPPSLSQVPSKLWAMHKNHAGFVTSSPPLKVTLKSDATLPCIRQYRLSPEALDGIQPVITSLLSQGILKETTSPCNTPILPLPKPGRTDEWRFVQDLRAVNNCVVPITPIVPDTHTILSSIPSDSTHYTVIDLCSAFFSIPVHPDSQYLFAFTYKRKQYTWTRMPQGYTESPTIYAAAVNRDLADLHLLGNSTLIQYADDLLLASPSKDVCIKDTLPLLTHLANKGHRASLSKMQSRTCTVFRSCTS